MLRRLLNRNFNLFLVSNYSKTFTSSNSIKTEDITSPGLSRKGSPEEASIGSVQKLKLNFKSKTDKEARTKLLQREFTSNPEFFKAFPYLKETLESEYSNDKDEDLVNQIKKNYNIPKSEESLDSKSDYFQSMLNKHKGYSTVLKEEEDVKHSEVAGLVDGYHTTTGPSKFMTREEKEKVHLEVDKKMQELEDSGLSRQEILFNKAEGLPLKEDKFFQFIKNNKMAREMLVKPTETFSLDLVIERALKQEIGPDGSLALNRKKFKLPEEMPITYELKKYKEQFNPKRPNELLKSDDYDYSENYLEKLKGQVNAEKKKPISFVNPPLLRPQLRRKYMIKTIQSKDITWKNLPLLCRFLNEGGKIMNRYQSRLPSNIHKKLARTVKHARNMGLLPNSDFVKAFHKLPLTSSYNEFYQDVARVIDQKTGMLKLVHQPSTQDKYSYSSYSSAVEANLNRSQNETANKFKQTLLLDNAEIPFTPNQDQMSLLLAQNHLVKHQNPQKASAVAYGSEQILLEQEKSAYEKVFSQINNTTSTSSIIESFISEKSYDVEHLKVNKKNFTNESFEKSKIKQEISNTMQSISDIIMTNKLDRVKPYDHSKETSKSKKYKIEPKMSQKEMDRKIKGVSKKSYKI